MIPKMMSLLQLLIKALNFLLGTPILILIYRVVMEGMVMMQVQ
ncbi:MAG: hypothetical protein ACFWTQ_01770 [Lactococcus sp.]|jgi:hypothetical protein